VITILKQNYDTTYIDRKFSYLKNCFVYFAVYVDGLGCQECQTHHHRPCVSHGCTARNGQITVVGGFSGCPDLNSDGQPISRQFFNSIKGTVA